MQREKFQSAEAMWFWFLFARGLPHSRTCVPCTSRRRACEILDVETLITKLYLAGRLTDAQLAIMKKYGDMRRAPNPNAWNEHGAARLWTTAMQTIHNAAAARGWVEQNGGTQ